MRIRSYTFTDPARGRYDFVHTRAVYGDLYEILTQPGNLVHANTEALNPEQTFDDWVIQNIATIVKEGPK